MTDATLQLILIYAWQVLGEYSVVREDRQFCSSEKVPVDELDQTETQNRLGFRPHLKSWNITEKERRKIDGQA